MEWLASLGGDEDSEAQQQLAAALAMIEGDSTPAARAPASPAVSDGNSSGANCTDSASEHDAEIGEDANDSAPLLDSPHSKPSGICLADKAAARVARKNRARLFRYHRSKAELVGLRQEAVRLQAQLDALTRKERSLAPATLKTSPCPFVDDVRDEIDPSEHARPLATLERVLEREMGWKEVAARERRRRERAQAVRRKLKRLLQDFERQSEELVQELPQTQTTATAAKRAVASPRVAPSLLGADTLEAFTYSGVAILNELYRMACSTCGISPVASALLGRTGGGLAYSCLLGQAIESGWTHDYLFPGDDPSRVAALMVRAITTQPPQRYVVRETIKHHNTAYPLLERRCTMRHQCAAGASVDLESVAMMQTFEANDSVVVVWTLSVHCGASSAPPVFRSSGWNAFQRSATSHGLAGQVACRSSARVHCAPSLAQARVEKMVQRQPVIDAWSSSVRTKQQTMSNRLLLVL